MLSRIAESLFWIGRYVERAEDTARILDVQTQLILEDPGVDEETTCRSLLADDGGGAGARRHPDRTPQEVLRVLAYDATSSASISRHAGCRPGERPPGAGDAVDLDVGGDEHHLPGRSPRGTSARCGRRWPSGGSVTGRPRSTASPRPP